MKKFLLGMGYYIAIPFIYFISLLPFPLLYLLSDGIYFILAKVLKYRKNIILGNLQNSFPHKDRKELEVVAKGFYHYLADLMLETLKLKTIRKEEILRRCKFTNPQVLSDFCRQNRSVIVVMGHYGNWEWANAAASLQSAYQINAIYKPLENPFFDDFFKSLRSRFGSYMVSMNHVLRVFIEFKHQPTITAFLSDQTAGPDHSYWVSFLNQETPVFPGPEKLSKKFNYPVVFCAFHLVQRGYYEITYEVISEQPHETAEGEISYLHTKKLEQMIVSKPELWLWSHNKWKHKRKEQSHLFTKD